MLFVTREIINSEERVSPRVLERERERDRIFVDDTRIFKNQREREREDFHSQKVRKRELFLAGEREAEKAPPNNKKKEIENERTSQKTHALI